MTQTQRGHSNDTTKTQIGTDRAERLKLLDREAQLNRRVDEALLGQQITLAKSMRPDIERDGEGLTELECARSIPAHAPLCTRTHTDICKRLPEQCWQLPLEPLQAANCDLQLLQPLFFHECTHRTYVFNNKLLLDNHIADVSNNFNEHRQNPATIITAGLYGKSSRNVLSGIIGQKITATFKGFLKLFNPIFKMFAKMLSKFQGSINGIRGMLRPIRNYFNNTAKMFYDKIQKFTIGILYSMHKMRNSMRRSMSGFNIMMHTLEHTKNSMESIQLALEGDLQEEEEETMDSPEFHP